MSENAGTAYPAGEHSAWNRGLTSLGAALEQSGLVLLRRVRRNEVIYTVKGGQVTLGFMSHGMPPYLEIKASDGYALSWDTTRGVPRLTKFFQVLKSVVTE